MFLNSYAFFYYVFQYTILIDKYTHAPVKNQQNRFRFLSPLITDRSVPLRFRITHILWSEILSILTRVPGPSSAPGPFGRIYNVEPRHFGRRAFIIVHNTMLYSERLYGNVLSSSSLTNSWNPNTLRPAKEELRMMRGTVTCEERGRITEFHNIDPG